jgi:hypothetical protein
MLDPRATSLSAASLSDLPMTMFGPTDPDLVRLGITATGNRDLTIVVTDPERPIGQVKINAGGAGNLLFCDNRAAEGNLHANIRMLGADNAIMFNDLSDRYIALHDVFLRSSGQMLFWGAGASSVGCSIEIEGEGRSILVGDDALISSDVWIRNHDMHAVHDLRTGERINRPPVDTVLERHVWLGQGAFLLNCQRVGAGSIVGAMSLAKGVIGECVAVAGSPARVIRYQVSWGREASGMTEDERTALGLGPVPV